MPGSKRDGFELQAPRDLNLITAASVMRFIDAEQAMLAGPFGSHSRVNARLRKLTDAGIFEQIFVGTIYAGRKALYTPTAAGAAIGKVPYRPIRRRPGKSEATLFLHHQMTLNDVYTSIKYRPGPSSEYRLLRWQTFSGKMSPTIAVIPDAVMELQTPTARIGSFLEVDLGTETMRVWRQKVKEYLALALSGEFKRVLPSETFRVLVVANSERRARSISATIAKSTSKLFWISTVDRIKQSGFWSGIWVRPGADQTLAL